MRRSGYSLQLSKKKKQAGSDTGVGNGWPTAVNAANFYEPDAKWKNKIRFVPTFFGPGRDDKYQMIPQPQIPGDPGFKPDGGDVTPIKPTPHETKCDAASFDASSLGSGGHVDKPGTFPQSGGDVTAQCSAGYHSSSDASGQTRQVTLTCDNATGAWSFKGGAKCDVDVNKAKCDAASFDASSLGSGGHVDKPGTFPQSGGEVTAQCSAGYHNSSDASGKTSQVTLTCDKATGDWSFKGGATCVVDVYTYFFSCAPRQAPTSEHFCRGVLADSPPLSRAKNRDRTAERILCGTGSRKEEGEAPRRAGSPGPRSGGFQVALNAVGHPLLSPLPIACVSGVDCFFESCAYHDVGQVFYPCENG